MLKYKIFLLVFLFLTKISYSVNNEMIITPTQKKCTGCALLNGEIKCIGGIIASTEYFEAQQDCFIPIPGFITINSKRHVKNIDDFSPEERTDFIEFLYKIRTTMREALTIETIFMIQEESASHFHVWLFPYHNWMQQFEHKISSIIPIMQWAKQNLKTEENIKDVLDYAQRLQRACANT